MVRSNRESGEEREDILMYSPSVQGKAFILELKTVREYGRMEEQCEEALIQAQQKNYRAEFEKNGYSDITVYGICFYRKECMVKTQ